MKIVHWDEDFRPNFGYQINVLPVYQKRQGNTVTIITREYNNADFDLLDKKFTEETGVKIVRLPIYGMYSGRALYKPGYIDRINEERADVIMCHSSDKLSTMTLIKKNRQINAPLVFDNHMLEMASKNKLRKLFRLYYRARITPIIKKNKFITIRTQNDNYIIDCLGVPEQLAPYISFGTDTELFKPNGEMRKNCREALGINEDAFVIIYAGKMREGKGGLLLAQAFEKKFETEKEVVIIVMGDRIDNEYGRKVEELLAKSENRIIRLDAQPYRELAKFYAVADLAVYAKQCSLSYFDVQAAGLPVVLEDNNVNLDRVTHNNGFTFSAGDKDDFVKKITACINMNDEEYSKIRCAARKNVIENYDYVDIADRYTQILTDEMIRQNNK